MLKAKDNPFSVDRVSRVRFRFSSGDLEEFLQILEKMGNRGALVGGRGFGKTTLLEDLVEPLVERNFKVLFLQVTSENAVISMKTWKNLAIVGSKDFILLDGAEQLNYFEWYLFRFLTRSAGGIVITSHVPGLLPTLKFCRTSPELLENIVADLIGPISPEMKSAIPVIFWRRGGNIREALMDLYDIFSDSDSETGRFFGQKSNQFT